MLQFLFHSTWKLPKQFLFLIFFHQKQITVGGQLHILLQTATDRLNAQRFHNFAKSFVYAFEPFPSQRHF
jgi:hypothetical protein